MVTFQSVQGLTYIFNFWHSGTLALRAERQSARMSEIKKVRTVCESVSMPLTPLPFKGLKHDSDWHWTVFGHQLISK